MFAAPPPLVLPPKGHKARVLALTLLLAAPFLFGALAVALGQDANWDLRNYHWYNAYAWLNHRWDIDLLPAQTPWFYNPHIDIPFYLLATHVPARMAGFTLGFVQGLNFILLFMLAHATLTINNPRQKVLVCAFLAALGMLGGGGIAQLGATFYDNITSLGTFTSALFIIVYFEKLFPVDPAKAKSFFLALLFGIPSGLMMGLKLPSVIFCVGLCLSLLLIRGTFFQRLWVTLAFGIGVLVGLTISLGPWGWFLQTHYGSPLFPYFNQYFHAPLAPLTSARDEQFIPHTFTSFLFFPFYFAHNPLLVGEIPWRDWRLPLLYALLPIALIARLLFGRVRQANDAIAQPHAARYLLWVAVLTYFVWLIMFSIYRYAIPLEMLTPLLIVCTVGMLPLKINTRAIITTVLLVVIAASVQGGNWYRRTAWLDHYVEAQFPPLGDTSNLMILMASFEPYSHVVTLLPPEVPIIRLQSNFASPNQDKRINKVAHEKVDGHKGRFLLLIPPWQHALGLEALGFFHLSYDPKTCQKVLDRLNNDGQLDLCPVTRLP